MDCTSEESARRTDSQALPELEGFPEAGGDDGLSESFQLLQMDVQSEHEEETSPAHNKESHSASWSSVGPVGLAVMGVSEVSVLRVDPED